MRKLNYIVFVIFIVTTVIAEILVFSSLRVDKEKTSILGGVFSSQEFNATTTSQGGLGTYDRRIKNGWGALGSVIVTKAGDSEFLLLDATSSLATTDAPTTSVVLVEIPAGMATGTYIFDVGFTTGLYLDSVSGNTGSSTITFR